MLIDALIIATGITPIILVLAGVREDLVVTALEVPKGTEVGEEVVVGGAIVCGETAVFPATRERGNIVEVLTHILLELQAR